MALLVLKCQLTDIFIKLRVKVLTLKGFVNPIAWQVYK